MNTDKPTAWIMQCDSCEYYHVYMSWVPTSTVYTQQLHENESWYVPSVVWDTKKEASQWLDQQYDRLLLD